MCFKLGRIPTLSPVYGTNLAFLQEAYFVALISPQTKNLLPAAGFLQDTVSGLALF
jgi:hypothetical protein